MALFYIDPEDKVKRQDIYTVNYES
ncbi:hypothetical protein CCACVL1_22309 [Corchorus capsularis]|uniref:Uncharacterized protein n=1 Tax=Corchorus capsularis TaxID=210143 RepID=A0A1R3H053_COCAP|nr:hypothetical protein CCACVL1_22309 [Corchorus capsularis]